MKQQDNHNVEQERQALAERLSRTEEIGRLGYWKWYFDTDESTCSDQIYRIFGLAPQSSMMKLKDFLHFLTPSSRQLVTQGIEGTTPGRGPFQVTLEARRADGSPIWLRSYGQLFFHANGKPAGQEGILLDITEQKRSELSIREHEERMAHVLNAVSDTMMLYDSDLRVVWANRTTLELMKHKPLIGSRCYEYFKNRITPCPDCELQLTFADGQQRRFTREFADPNGSKRWLNITVDVAVHDEEGKPKLVLGTGRDITDKRLGNMALQDSQKRFEMAVSAGGVVIWEYWPDTRQFVTFHLDTLLGISSSELGAYIDDWYSRIYPEDQEKFRSQIELLSDGAIQRMEVEYRIIDNENKIRWLRSSGSLIRESGSLHRRLLGSTIELTDIKETQQTLADYRERLELTLLGAQLGMWDFYPQQNRVIISELLAEMLHLRGCLPECTTEDLTQYVHPEDIEKVYLNAKAHFEDAISSIDCEFRFQVGSYPWQRIVAQGMITQRDDIGRPVRVTGIMREVTHEREIESARLEADKVAERSLRLASLGTLAGGIAHEINQPLTVLKAEVDGLHIRRQLQQNIPLELMYDVLEIASRQIDRIDRIVNHMQYLIREQQPREMLQPVLLAEVARRAESLLGQQLHQHGIFVQHTHPQDVPAIQSNPVLLEQITLNLLINAIHALDDVEAGQRGIFIATFQKEDFVVLEIADSGPGIAQDVLNKIFDPFFSTKQTRRSMGLGLSIVENFVQSLSGTITASNREQGGAVFRVWLPASQEALS